MRAISASRLERFGEAYARVREIEGRGSGGEEELLALPYLSNGPLAKQWGVRARTFDAFTSRVLAPLERQRSRPLRILDLGAGNGWLSARLTRRGHAAVAVDLRTDAIDGLGAAAPFRRTLPRMFARVAASFADLPFRAGRFDLALFDASLHYTEDLRSTLAEAVRTVSAGGRVAILDSPFYGHAALGDEMAAEKKRAIRRQHGNLADALLSIPSIEYLTRERLDGAAAPLGLAFRRHRVLYPLWYEARPALAFLRRQRRPSRFDLWEADVP